MIVTLLPMDPALISAPALVRVEMTSVPVLVQVAFSSTCRASKSVKLAKDELAPAMNCSVSLVPPPPSTRPVMLEPAPICIVSLPAPKLTATPPLPPMMVPVLVTVFPL